MARIRGAGTDQRSIRTSQRCSGGAGTGQVQDNFVSIHIILLHRRFTSERFFRLNIRSESGCAKLARDRKTGLPFYAYFDDLGRLFSELGASGASTVELPFLDLAGLCSFTIRYRQAKGDSV